MAAGGCVWAPAVAAVTGGARGDEGSPLCWPGPRAAGAGWGPVMVTATLASVCVCNQGFLWEGLFTWTSFRRPTKL